MNGSEELYRWRPNDRTESVLSQMSRQGEIARGQQRRRGEMLAEDQLARGELMANLPGQMIGQYRAGKDYARREDMDKQNYRMGEENIRSRQLGNVGQGLENTGRDITNRGAEINLGALARSDKMMQGIDPTTGKSYEELNLTNPIIQGGLQTGQMQRKSAFGQSKNAKNPMMTNEEYGWNQGIESGDLANQSTRASIAAQGTSQKMANQQMAFALQDRRIQTAAQIAESYQNNPEMQSQALAMSGFTPQESQIAMSIATKAKSQGETVGDLAYMGSPVGQQAVSELSDLNNQVENAKQLQQLAQSYKQAKKAATFGVMGLGGMSDQAKDAKARIINALEQIGHPELADSIASNVVGTDEAEIDAAIKQVMFDAQLRANTMRSKYAGQTNRQVVNMLSTSLGTLGIPLQPPVQGGNGVQLLGDGKNAFQTNSQFVNGPQGQYVPTGPASGGIQPINSQPMINLRNRAKNTQVPAGGAPK